MGTITLDNMSADQFKTALESYVSETEGVSASNFQQSGTTVTVDVTVNGVTEQLTVNLPDIDGAESSEEDASECLKAVSEKLDAFVASLKADAAGKTSTASIYSTMTDIYAIIALLQKVSQEQLQVANEMRIQQHAAQQSTLQSQADAIRSNADEAFTENMWSAAISAVGCVASGVMLGVGTGMQVKAANNSSVAGTRSIMNSANAEMKTANTFSATQAEYSAPTKNVLQAQENAQITQNEAATKLGPGEGNVNVLQQETIDARNAYQTSAAKVETDTQNVQTKTEQLHTSETELQTAKTEQQQAQQAYDADHSEANRQRLDQANDQVTQKQTAYDNNLASLKEARSELSTDRQDCSRKALSYNRCLTNDANAEGITPEQKAAVQEFQKNEQAAMRQNAVDGTVEAFNSAAELYGTSVQGLMSSWDFKKGETFSQFGNITNQFLNAGSNMLKAAAESTQAEGQAASKEADVRLDQLQAEGEQIKELRDEAQQLFNDVRQLTLNILETDSQTSQAIRSI